jgi:hypothetical protein
MSMFDGIQKAVFQTSELLYGDDATWIPSNNSSKQIEKVLYNSPNDPVNLGEQDKYVYRPYNYSIEYFEGQFSGLKESVDDGNEEHIEINGIKLVIREVRTKADGKTYIAFGEKVEDD